VKKIRVGVILVHKIPAQRNLAINLISLKPEGGRETFGRVTVMRKPKMLNQGKGNTLLLIIRTEREGFGTQGGDWSNSLNAMKSNLKGKEEDSQQFLPLKSGKGR